LPATVYRLLISIATGEAVYGTTDHKKGPTVLCNQGFNGIKIYFEFF
jgi:hypothetical protein